MADREDNVYNESFPPETKKVEFDFTGLQSKYDKNLGKKTYETPESTQRATRTPITQEARDKRKKYNELNKAIADKWLNGKLLDMIPCWPGSKIPIPGGWPLLKGELPEFPTIYNKDFNVAVHMGDGILGIDIDTEVKDPATMINGVAFWGMMLAKYNGGDINTFKTKTPKDGRHYLFRVTPEQESKLGNAQFCWDENNISGIKGGRKVAIECKLRGKCLMFPGSIKDGKEYIAMNDMNITPIAPLPDWLFTMLSFSRASKTPSKEWFGTSTHQTTDKIDPNKKYHPYSFVPADLDLVRMFLVCFDLSRVNDHAMWIYIGALVKCIANAKNVNNDMEGFLIWDEWSKSGSTYDAGDPNQQAAYQWKHIKHYDKYDPSHAFNTLKNFAIQDTQVRKPDNFSVLTEALRKFYARNGNYRGLTSKGWNMTFGPDAASIQRAITMNDREYIVREFGLQIFDKYSPETVNDLREIIQRKDVTKDMIIDHLRKCIAYVTREGKSWYVFKTFNDKNEIIYEETDSISAFKHYYIWIDSGKKTKDGDTKKVKLSVKDIIEDCCVKDLSYNNIKYLPYVNFIDAVFHKKHSILKNTGEKDAAGKPIYIRNVFNRCTGFRFDHIPGFKVDMSKIKRVLSYIKEVLCAVQCPKRPVDITQDCEFDCSCWKTPVFLFVLKMLAWMIQFPNKRLKLIMLLGGGMRIGKSTFIRYFCKYLMGLKYFYVMNKKSQLLNKFNVCKANRQFILYEEVCNWAGDEEINGELKFEGTETHQEFEIKNGLRYTGKVYHTSVITTNKQNVVHIQEDCGRYVCLWCNSKYAKNMGYFAGLGAEWKDEESMRHLYHYLMGIDLTDWNRQQTPDTAWKKHMQKNSTDALNSLISYTLRNYGFPQTIWDNEGWIQTKSLHEYYKEYCRFEEYKNVLGYYKFIEAVEFLFSPEIHNDKVVNGIKGRKALKLPLNVVVLGMRRNNASYMTDRYDTLGLPIVMLDKDNVQIENKNTNSYCSTAGMPIHDVAEFNNLASA